MSILQKSPSEHKKMKLQVIIGFAGLQEIFSGWLKILGGALGQSDRHFRSPIRKRY